MGTWANGVIRFLLFILHLNAWRQGFSLNLDLGLRLASPVVFLSVPPTVLGSPVPTSNAGILCEYRDSNSGAQAVVTLFHLKTRPRLGV